MQSVRRSLRYVTACAVVVAKATDKNRANQIRDFMMRLSFPLPSEVPGDSFYKGRPSRKKYIESDNFT